MSTLYGDGSTLVLVWTDGTVSNGLDNLKDYMLARQYGQADDVPSVFVNDAGTLKPVLMITEPLFYDESDYAYPTTHLFVNVPGVNVQDEHAPFCAFTQRVDGRA